MQCELFDTSTKEGKMLYLAIAALMGYMKIDDPAELVKQLEAGVEQWDNFTM